MGDLTDLLFELSNPVTPSFITGVRSYSSITGMKQKERTSTMKGDEKLRLAPVNNLPIYDCDQVFHVSNIVMVDG